MTVEWPANWDRDNAALTYTVQQGGVAVGTVKGTSTFWSRPRLSHTFAVLATASQDYTVVAQDPFGNRVTSPVVRPSVPTTTTKSPPPGATGVAVGTTTTRTPLRVTFSEPVTGVSSSTLRLRRGTTAVSAAVSYDGTSRTATLTPSAPLAPDATHTLALTAGIRSDSGGELAPQEWSFLTGPVPVVTSRTPASGATSVSRTANITATTSEPVTGVSTSTVTLTQTSTGAAVAATVGYLSTTRVATVDPAATLAASTQYTVRVGTGIQDLAGNPLTPLSWTFTTASG
jgi:hypothetical protein